MLFDSSGFASIRSNPIMGPSMSRRSNFYTTPTLSVYSVILFTHTQTHTQSDTYTQTRIYIYIHLHTRARTYAQSHIHTHTHIHTQTHNHLYIHTPTHTRTHVRTITHTHTCQHLKKCHWLRAEFDFIGEHGRSSTMVYIHGRFHFIVFFSIAKSV